MILEIGKLRWRMWLYKKNLNDEGKRVIYWHSRPAFHLAKHKWAVSRGLHTFAKSLMGCSMMIEDNHPDVQDCKVGHCGTSEEKNSMASARRSNRRVNGCEMTMGNRSIERVLEAASQEEAQEWSRMYIQPILEFLCYMYKVSTQTADTFQRNTKAQPFLQCFLKNTTNPRRLVLQYDISMGMHWNCYKGQ